MMFMLKLLMLLYFSEQKEFKCESDEELNAIDVAWKNGLIDVKVQHAKKATIGEEVRQIFTFIKMQGASALRAERSFALLFNYASAAVGG